MVGPHISDTTSSSSSLTLSSSSQSLSRSPTRQQPLSGGGGARRQSQHYRARPPRDLRSRLVAMGFLCSRALILRGVASESPRSRCLTPLPCLEAMTSTVEVVSATTDLDLEELVGLPASSISARWSWCQQRQIWTWMSSSASPSRSLALPTFCLSTHTRGPPHPLAGRPQCFLSARSSASPSPRQPTRSTRRPPHNLPLHERSPPSPPDGYCSLGSFSPPSGGRRPSPSPCVLTDERGGSRRKNGREGEGRRSTLSSVEIERRVGPTNMWIPLFFFFWTHMWALHFCLIFTFFVFCFMCHITAT